MSESRVGRPLGLHRAGLGLGVGSWGGSMGVRHDCRNKPKTESFHSYTPKVKDLYNTVS